VDDQRAGRTSDWKVWETRTQSWQSKPDANEPRVVFFFKLVSQGRQFQPLANMSLTQLSLGELRQRLLSHGETAPRSWGKSHITLRLAEIEGTNLQGPVKEKSPLRQLEIRINQASRRKSDLQQLAQEIGLEITGNETIAVLKARSMDQASRLTPGHFLDPVGFGKYSDKTYGEVMAMDSQYCQWVLVTAKEGESCARLQRLAFWLQEHKNNDAPMIPAAKTSNKQKKVGTAQGSKMEIKTNEEIVSQGASSSNAEMQQSIQQLMGAVKSLATELESVRQENKESKRRVHHSEDVTTSNSEWDGVSQA